MLVVVTHVGAALPQVRVLAADEEPTPISAEVEVKQAPNPILPVRNELIYAFVGFMALFLMMRYWLFPALKKGIDARNAMIRSRHESADALRASARAEAAAYDAGLAEARVEAAAYLDAARQEVDADRQRKLVEVNGRIAERKAVAAQEHGAAKATALGHIEDAVADVASSIAGRALNRDIDPGSIRGIVSEVVNAGVTQ